MIWILYEKCIKIRAARLRLVFVLRFTLHSFISSFFHVSYYSSRRFRDVHIDCKNLKNKKNVEQQHHL